MKETRKKINDICKCNCHVKGDDVLHMMPCCDYTYEKYINRDGSIDYEEYEKIVKAYKNKNKNY